ncbi:hypothetical protein DIPPA_07165 [Diplonema papillatum]|nr:hypothetical protein DIPPA_07165 [Diplonema papillatum]
MQEVKSALSKPCKKKPRSRPSGELWRLDEENVGYSPACQEEGLDAVVDLLDALEGRSASRQKQLQERLRKLHDDGRSRQLRLQEENRRLDERRPGKKMTEKQAKAAVARLVQRKRPTGSEAEGEVKQPPPPDKPAKPRVVINKEKQKALVARLYTTDLEKRGIRENQRAEQRRELELEELRTEYPVRSKEEIKAQCNAWSAKGSMQLADKTRLGIEEKELLLKQKHKHNSFTSADSVVREDILSLLVSPKATMDGDPEPLLNCQKYMENPCVDLGAPWVATSRKSAARRAEEADRCFFTPNEKAPGEYIPARDPGWVPPHAHWSTEGARKLVDRTAKEIKTRMDRRKWLDSGYRDPNVETPDTKQRAALLGNLIHPVSNEGLFPHQHPYINQYDWLPNSPAVERELESDRAFLSANDEY